MEIVCSHCQTINRIAEGKPAHKARCGRCKNGLFRGHAFAVDGNALNKHIQRDGLPFLVDFWAPWCGPCKMMAPQFEQAAQRLEPGVRLAKLNTEQESHTAGHYNIRSIPTMILFRNGKELQRQSGGMNAEQIVQWVRQFVV